MKSWNVKYKNHDIRVENSWSEGERLFIYGELQDIRKGVFSSRLYGKIKEGDGAGEDIKASLGGWWTIGCYIFADNKLIFPTDNN